LGRVWEALGVASISGDEESRLAWLRRTDYPEFAGALSVTHGVIRGVPATRRGFSPANTVWRDCPADAPSHDAPIIYCAPDASLRDGLFMQLHGAVRRMSKMDMISKLSATVIAELQAYGDANKRLARVAYRWGRAGFDGSVDAHQRLTLALYNQDDESAVDFEKMHDTLADYYTEYVALSVAEDEDAIIGSIEPVDAETTHPQWNADTARVIKDHLNEPFFNRALIALWAHDNNFDLSPYMDADGNIMTNELFTALPKQAALQLFGTDDKLKAGFITAIIRAYADNDQSIFTDIHYLTEPYWPVN
jgi:hypothetical protein